MKTVHKAVLPELGEFQIQMPEGAEIVTLREQYGRPTVWYVCDPQAKIVARGFRIVGTGHVAPDVGKYVGTFFVDGVFVFHVFEIP